MSLRDEILEQPEAVRRQLGSESGAATLQALAARLRAEPVDSVVIAARGSSDHAAIYGQYLFGVRQALTVGLAAPSIVSLYGTSPSVGRSLVIGISQSGASPDVVAVVAAANRQGAPTLAITNDPGSPLAEAAEYVLDLAAGPERSIAATKTYTCSLLALARLSAALGPAAALDPAPEDPAGGAIAALPDALEAALAVEPEVEELARDLAATDRCLVLGRGFEYATAREWALKLKELAQVFADPYSSADFLHGPIALARPGVPALAVVPESPTRAGLVQTLTTLRDLGVETVILSELPDVRALGWRSIALPAGVPEWLRPISSIVPAQLLAYHLTIAKGLDPEAPLNLSKVTRTV
jgi:glucosamine--fructose-6-phosphate aminotransferase (isomerizing)